MIERAGGLTTVPQIFVDGEHLGDCMDMMEMDADGDLDARLKLPGDEDVGGEGDGGAGG
jgi:glutaredoxin 3